MDPTSRCYTAFLTPFGVFEFTVLPFGLVNAPACFARIVSRVFADCYEFSTVYLDDVAIHSFTFENHLSHLRMVSTRLREEGIMLKFKRCSFLQSCFRYLGFLVTPEGLRPDPKKTDALSAMAVPSSVSQVRSFLGLASYFRRFVPNFSVIVEPLQSLTRLHVPFRWSSECRQAFDLLKSILTSSPALRHPHFLPTFYLSTDASAFAIGGVLEQPAADSSLHPIAYVPRRLTTPECNYAVYEREALAVVPFIKYFRCYLLGSYFVVYTDNSALTSLFRIREPTGRLARWICLLSEFDFEVRHWSGKTNVVADALCRGFQLSSSTPTLPSVPFSDILAYLRDGVEPVENDSRFRRTVQRYVVLEGSLYRRSKLTPLRVLFTIDDLHSVLSIYHDQLGHFAFDTVWQWIRTRFWRPHLYAEVRHFIFFCSVCQQFQLCRPVYSFDGRSAIFGFGHWSMDVLGPFPSSTSGMVCLFTAIESLTSYP